MLYLKKIATIKLLRIQFNCFMYLIFLYFCQNNPMTSLEHTTTKKMYSVRVPIKSDLKKWLAKWLGYSSADDLELMYGQSEIGSLVALACTNVAPTLNEKTLKTIDSYDESVIVWIPRSQYLKEDKIVQLNQALYNYMIAQIVVVAIVKRQSDDIQSPQSAIFEYYQSYFNIDMSIDALEKASQRFRSQRNFPRFITRK